MKNIINNFQIKHLEIKVINIFSVITTPNTLRYCKVASLFNHSKYFTIKGRNETPSKQNWNCPFSFSVTRFEFYMNHKLYCTSTCTNHTESNALKVSTARPKYFCSISRSLKEIVRHAVPELSFSLDMVFVICYSNGVSVWTLTAAWDKWQLLL